MTPQASSGLAMLNRTHGDGSKLEDAKTNGTVRASTAQRALRAHAQSLMPTSDAARPGIVCAQETVEASGGAEHQTDSGMDVIEGTGGGSSSPVSATGSWAAGRGLGGREDTVVDGAKPSTSGVVGLTNLGNTCFMNSMLQCLSNVAPLRGFFVSGDYEPELNTENPLGAEGLLAQSFASLLRLMWGNGASVVSPRNFKHVLGRFAPQFAGYGQQDSQELCNYVLDKLHEDVNRVRTKPYIENYEAKETEADDAVVAEVRRRHRLRNDSRIADLFEGFFKSTVVCPKCQRVSVTFDPFMSIAVPLSVADARKLAVTLRTYDGALTTIRVSVPLSGNVKHLLAAVCEQANQTLSVPLSPERLVAVEVYNAKLQAVYQPGSRLEKLQNGDYIFVCETAPPAENGGVAAAAVAEEGDAQPLLVICVQRVPPTGYGASNKFMGLPLIFALPRSTSGQELTDLVASKLRRYQRDPDAPPPSEADGSAAEPDVPNGGGGAILGSALHGGGPMDDDIHSPTAPKPPPARAAQWRLFHSTMATGSFGYEALGAPVPLTDAPCEFATPGRGSSTYTSGSSYGSSAASSSDTSAKLESRHIVIEWQSAAFNPRGCYERAKVEADEAEKAGIGCGRTPVGERTPAASGNGVELKACLELFSREETLDAENAWYCDRCKAHREATKKLQIWSLPAVLVVHLKRFSAQGMWRRKNDTPVDFPFEVDLAPYCLQSQHEGGGETIYELMAVSNHYGSTGGGHYTAFARHSESGQWHKFDDSHTAAVEPKDVVTPAAYVLMYCRRGRSATRASPEC